MTAMILVKGDFLPPGTFEGTSVETTIIQLNSDIAHDKLITSDFFIESRVTTFNTILSNDVECLALIEAPNIERISPISSIATKSGGLSIGILSEVFR